MLNATTPQVTAELIGDPTFESFCDYIFRSVPRRDQRRKGAAYVAGVLRARGRRSLRNIAHASGAEVNEQSLHHFVSQSTWEWRSVRSTTARYLSAAESADAFVVHEPGLRSGGTGPAALRGEEPGRAAQGRAVVGMWGAAGHTTVPLAWWQTSHAMQVNRSDGGGTSRQGAVAGIVQAYRDAVRGSGVSVPLVLDARELSVPLLLHALGPTVPAIIRIGGDQKLRPVGAAGSTSRDSWVPAELLARLHGNMRQPVGTRGDGEFEDMALTLGVHVPELQRGSGVRLLGGGPTAELLALGGPHRPWPQDLWLVWGSAMDIRLKVYLASLIDRIGSVRPTASEQLGLGDYRSQSRDGFQRHSALIGAAHAYLVARNSGDAGGIDLFGRSAGRVLGQNAGAWPFSTSTRLPTGH